MKTLDKIWARTTEHSIIVVVAILVVLFGLVIGFYTTITITTINDEPCSYFKNYDFKNVPARCVKEFTR